MVRRPHGCPTLHSAASRYAGQCESRDVHRILWGHKEGCLAQLQGRGQESQGTQATKNSLWDAEQSGDVWRMNEDLGDNWRPVQMVKHGARTGNDHPVGEKAEQLI